MFKSLVSAVSEQQQEIKQVFVLFPYFETWNPDLIAECCRVSSIAEFPPDKIILGPDIGNPHTVYFVLEGVCKMMRNIDVEVKVDSRQRVGYKLHKVVGLKNSNSESKRERYSSRLFNQKIYESQSRDMVKFSEEKVEKNGEVRDKLEVNAEVGDKLEVNAEVRDKLEVNAEVGDKLEVNAEVGDKPEVNAEVRDKVEVNAEVGDKLEVNAEKYDNSAEENIDEIMTRHVEIIENPHENIITPSNTSTLPDAKDSAENTTITKNNSNIESSTTRTFDKTENYREKPFSEQESETTEREIPLEPDHHLKILEECKKRRNETNRVSRKTAFPEKPQNAKRFFIQIGFLYRGACFGLEKSERENFVLSATTVRCLKIPEGFLLRHNPCNIWKRIGLFHSLYLPKDEKVFEVFRFDRMWVEAKKQLTEEIVSAKNFSSRTLICDVPYSIKLAEGEDLKSEQEEERIRRRGVQGKRETGGVKSVEILLRIPSLLLKTLMASDNLFIFIMISFILLIVFYFKV